MQAATLSLPDIASSVPLSVTGNVGGSNEHPVTVMLSQRLSLGLPHVLPDPTKHATLQDCIIDNLKAVGYRPNAFSERVIELTLDADFDTEYLECAEQIDQAYAIYTDSKKINLFDPLNSLESHCTGLGETVMYWLNHRNKFFATSGDCFELFCDYRLEGCDEDEIAKEHLLDMGYGEGDLTPWLPSYVKHSLGGSTFVKPEQRLCNEEFLSSLQQLTTDADRLYQLLTQELPNANEKARNNQSNFFRQGYFDSIVIGYFREGQDMAITEVLDEEYNVSMQEGEEKLLIIDRLSEKIDNQQIINHDGLEMVADVLNIYTILDELITLLRKIE